MPSHNKFLMRRKYLESNCQVTEPVQIRYFISIDDQKGEKIVNFSCEKNPNLNFQESQQISSLINKNEQDDQN